MAKTALTLMTTTPSDYTVLSAEDLYTVATAAVYTATRAAARREMQRRADAAVEAQLLEIATTHWDGKVELMEALMAAYAAGKAAAKRE